MTSTSKDFSWVCDELERLGPVYVKLGQLVALQSNVPADLAQALESLQDRASIVPFSLIFESKKPAELEHVDEIPIAAASLGIVYSGIWTTREETPFESRVVKQRVAIKVLRPGIRRELAANLWSFSLFLRRFSDVSESANHVLGTVRRYRRTLWNEVDYLKEAASSLELEASLGKVKGWNRVPRVLHADKEFLVMEYVPGIRISDVEGIRAAGMDPAKVADNLLEAFLHQCLSSGLFHSDPHPGNVSISVAEKKLVWYDCGSVTLLDGPWRSLLIELSIAIARGDVGKVVDKLEGMGIVKSDKRSRRAVVKSVRVLAGKSFDMVNLFDVKDVKDLRDAFNSDSKYVILGKSILAINATCVKLDPTFALVPRSTPFVKKLWGSGGEINMLEEFVDVAKSMSEMPGRVATLEDRLHEIDGDSVDRHKDVRELFGVLVGVELLLHLVG